MPLLNGFLFHQAYSSQYYDPVKAHDYYMKNRKLKGRSSSKLSDAGKEKWDYVKNNIESEKKLKLTQLQTQRDNGIKSFRDEASKLRKSIADSLKSSLSNILSKYSDKRSALSDQISAQIKEISDEAQKKKDALPTIPKSASEEQKAILRAQNAKDLKTINDVASEARDKVYANAKTERQQLSDQSTIDRASQRDEATVDREQIQTDLTKKVDDARTTFSTKKEEIISKYENILNKEYGSILSINPQVSKSKSKTSKKTKTAATSNTPISSNKSDAERAAYREAAYKARNKI